MSEKLSVCIPNWNRFDLLFKSFEHIINDDRVDEVVVVDDCSDRNIFEKVKEKSLQFGKMKLFRNIENKDCYENKMIAISYALNDWCLLADSDNIFTVDYLNKIYNEKWDEKTILAPDFAKPNYSYKNYSGLTVTKQNVAQYISQPIFPTCLNTCNYFVNRDRYLSVWDDSINPHTYDTLYFNYCWLKSGGEIKIVRDLEYFHLVHKQSHYQNNVHKSGNLLPEIINKIKHLV